MDVGSKMDTELQQQSEKGKETINTGQLSNKSIKLGVASSSISTKSGSAILDFVISRDEMDSMEMLEEELLVEPRKARAASTRVADLIKSLKPRKKGPIDKGKSKQGRSFCLGCSSLFTLSKTLLIWNVKGLMTLSSKWQLLVNLEV